jgi:hypothetical protein
MLTSQISALYRRTARRGTSIGLAPPDAEHRADQVIAQAKDAIAKARHGSDILAFMIGCSLLLGLPAGWLASAAGGQHRDGRSFIIFGVAGKSSGRSSFGNPISK